MQVVVGHVLQDGRTQSAADDTIFHRNDATATCADGLQDVLVDGLEEAHVVVPDCESLLPELPHRFGYDVAQGTEAEHGYVVALAEQTSAPYGQGLQGAAPVGQDSAAPRVTDDEGTASGQLCRVHESAQLVLVHGRTDGQVRYGTQGCQVEGAVMRSAVLSHEARAVEAEDDGQAAQAYVVDDVVEGTLGEGGVDVAEGDKALLSQSAREGDGMPLGNADIEGTLGHLAHHDGEAAACRHGRRDAHYAVVAAGQLKQRLAEDVLILRRQALGVVFQAFAGIGVVLARSMVDGGVLLGSLEAFALDGVEMQELGAGHVLYLSERADKLYDVMAVDGTEVADVQSLEDVLLVVEQGLQ